jgi:hypothetical protein
VTVASRPSAAQDAYAARSRSLEASIASLEARSARLGRVRALAFVVAVAIGGYSAFRHVSIALAVVGGLAAALFVALVVGHALVHARIDALGQRLGLVRRGVERLAGDASKNPTGDAFAPAEHPYAGDLDLFGRASVFQLVTTAETALGQRTLAAWLLAGAAPDAVAARQEAVRELEHLDAFREELAFEGLRAGDRGESADKLLAWAEAVGRATSLSEPPYAALSLVARVLPVFTVGVLVAGEIAGAELGPLRHAWLVTALVQLGLRLALGRVVDPVVGEATSREQPLGRYRRLLAAIEKSALAEQAKSPLLRAEARRIAGDESGSASRAMRSLERIVGFAELRHQGIVHFVAELLLGWDVHCAVALDGWRRRHGVHARAWLEALATIEALASLATFAREHPGYAFPEITSGPSRFEAEGLAHPLLRESARVANDVALEAPGHALLVTGSNMSGKSTLLRAMGTAEVMALAGAPVCATRLRATALAVHTSMRIRDSLEAGVSHFYAELERLKGVVDAVDRGDRVLFLLDEILHGTNSRERQIGAKAVVLHLVRAGAIGAVTSHDLGLAALEAESSGRVVNMHFEEQVAGDAMSFDYRIRRGPVTTANALRLMKRVGLPVDPDAEETDERASSGPDRPETE